MEEEDEQDETPLPGVVDLSQVIVLPKQGEKKFLPPDYEEFEGESQAQEPGTAGSGDASTGEDDPTDGYPLLKMAHVPEHIRAAYANEA